MIILEPIMHKGSLCIAIRGRYPSKVSIELRKIPGILYSATQGCFYLIYSSDVLSRLRSVVREIDTYEEKSWEPFVASAASLELPKDLVVIPEEYRAHLVKRRYSPATRDNYLAQFNLFLKFIYPTRAEDITDKQD